MKFTNRLIIKFMDNPCVPTTVYFNCTNALLYVTWEIISCIESQFFTFDKGWWKGINFS